MLPDSELLGNPKVGIHIARSNQRVSPGRAIAEKAEVDRSRASVCSEGCGIQKTVSRTLSAHVWVPNNRRAVCCMAVAVRVAGLCAVQDGDRHALLYCHDPIHGPTTQPAIVFEDWKLIIRIRNKTMPDIEVRVAFICGGVIDVRLSRYLCMAAIERIA